MKRYDELTKDMLARVLQHGLDNPVDPSITRAAVLFGKVGTLIASYTSQSGTQVFGRGGYRAGALERRLLADEIRVTLVDMAATARGLEPVHPGISEQFRLGRQTDSHQKLLATAQAFLMAVAGPEVKLLFTDRAFAADFDVQLTAKITALAAAVARKASGLQSQKQGTVGMEALRREATETMTELRALMVKYLRGTNPGQIEVWKAAARIYRAPSITSAASKSASNDTNAKIVKTDASPPLAAVTQSLASGSNQDEVKHQSAESRPSSARSLRPRLLRRARIPSLNASTAHD